MRIRVTFLIESFAGLIFAFVLWEAGVRLFAVPEFILPAPSAVLAEGITHAKVLARHTLITVVGTSISLAIGAGLGMLVGLIIGYSRTLSRLFYPLLGGFHALPMSAFIPIFVVWFGIGMAPKIIAGVLIAFFPVVVNVVTGLRTIEPDLWDMLTTLGASKRQVYLKVGIPRTLPYFFASLKVAAAGAFIGNIVGEMLAAGAGLGYVLVVATTSLKLTLAFAALTILLLFGMVMFMFFDILEKRIAPWAFRAEDGRPQSG